MRVVTAARITFILSLLIACQMSQAQTKPQTTAKPAANKYAEAKDLIRRARTLLGDFVTENPNTEDAHFARLQRAALENIFKTDVPIVPVSLTDEITWRVIGVQTRDSDTKVTLEIENTAESRQAAFYQFNLSPLTLVAAKKVYAMKKHPIKIPSGAQEYSDWGWQLQPTQAVRVEVYFDALDESAIDGILKYVRDDRGRNPARFSLMNVNQAPPN